MNDITRQFGFTFRDDVLYSTEPAPDDERYTAPRVPHPAVQHVPRFDFAVSCSIDPGTSRGRTVIEGTRLWSMPPEYHNENYMPFAQHRPEMRCGAFVQAWAARAGQGRVLAFADSTVFSSFCIYQPGKAELLLNLVEWLNHQDPAFDPAWLVLGAGRAGPGGAVTWRLTRCRSGFQISRCQSSDRQILKLNSGIYNHKSLLLLAAGCCGWAAGSARPRRPSGGRCPCPRPSGRCRGSSSTAPSPKSRWPRGHITKTSRARASACWSSGFRGWAT